jgi:hypothetical protein
MSVLRWAAAVPVVVVGVLTGNTALAVAAGPPGGPAPAPTTTPSPTPGATPAPAQTPTPPADTADPPANPADGHVQYVTTVTTTTVNAPIIVVAAPITTTNTTNPDGLANQARERFVVYMRGCGQDRGRSPAGGHVAGVRRARVRLARNATLIVRVNGRRVASLHIPPSARRHRTQRVPLRLRLARDGWLTIRRPSGRIASIPACQAL